jgi:FKBP-type peptidyl-prolyl cis-trans isomerase
LQPGTSLQPACPLSCILDNAAADDDASAASRPAAFAAEDGQTLCDASCVSKLESVEAVTTPSGLQYKDIIVGTGEAAAHDAQQLQAVANQEH